jgi:peptidylprolyl isomerase
MRRLLISLAGLSLIAAAPVWAAGAEPDWRPLDPANTLVVETTKGRIVVEMAPELAPLAVERVKRLAHEKVYDGLLFHRVIEGFVDQTGDPNNRDGGTSTYPDLPPEFSARLLADGPQVIVQRRSDGVEGFLRSTPIAGVGAAEQAQAADGKLRAWGVYCAGVVGMGRQAGIDTANAEIFFMRAPARRLDHDYAVWGRVVQGLDVVRAIKVGEPPKDPDRMLRVRLMNDLPADQQPKLQVLNERGAVFRGRLTDIKARKGASFSICDVATFVRMR